MTPKEKALDLVMKFRTWAYDGTDQYANAASSDESAVEIAMICVKELLEDDMYGMDEVNFEKRIAYWEAVYMELESM